MASIQGIYVALFGRPADPLGLAYFNGETQNGADLTAIGDLASTAEYQSRFVGQSNTQIINSIYQSLFERDAEPDGLAFFVRELEAGRLNINNIAIAILDGAQNDDLVSVNAKIAAADLFTAHLDLDGEVDAYKGTFAASVGRDYLADVEANDPATPQEADIAILRLFPDGGQEPGGGGNNDDNHQPRASNFALTPIAEDSGARIITTAELLANATDRDGDRLTVLDLRLSSGNGTLVDNRDGTWTYTPAANDDTQASFVYRVSDGQSNDAGTATLDITPVNDAPVANPDAYTSNEDTQLTIPLSSLLNNDTDVDNAGLTVTNLTQPTNGTLTLNNDGTFTYAPNANYSGVDSFTYKATDGSAESNITTVTINVTPVNDAPVANPDAYTTNEDTPLTITRASLLSNDTDAENDVLTVDEYTQSTYGTITVNDQGSFVYTPNQDYSGPDAFTYTITDPTGATSTTTVNIDVAEVPSTFTVVRGQSYASDNGGIHYVTLENFVDGESTIDIAGFGIPGAFAGPFTNLSEIQLVDLYERNNGSGIGAGRSTAILNTYDNNTFILIDSNGNGKLDVVDGGTDNDVFIKLIGTHTINASDFIA